MISGNDIDLTTLHIRCGSDIQPSLQQAGFQGDFQPFADPFCIGPVPCLLEEDFLQTRARFIADAFNLPLADILTRQRQEYGVFERLQHYQRIVLWFEHDTYDQLILAFLLKRLGEARPHARIELIAVDSFPGIERFIGLGQLNPEQLRQLWPQRQPVTDVLLRLGAEAWDAITAPHSSRLEQLVQTATPALPMMGRALRRHLRELPDATTGLGLTQQLMLEIVRDQGPLPVGKTFAYLMREREPLPYLGDLMFWWLLQPLLSHGVLVIVADVEREWPHRQIALTELGRMILAGQRHWLDLYTGEQWVGGICIQGRGGDR